MSRTDRPVFIFRFRWAILAVAVVVGVAAAVYGGGVARELDPGGFGVRDGEAERAAELARDRLGRGATDVVALVEVPGRSASDPEFQEVLRRVATRVAGTAGVARVDSPLSPGGEPLVSADRRTAMVTVTVAGDVRQKEASFGPIARALRQPGARVMVGGDLAGAVEGQRLAEEDLTRAELALLPVLALLLLVFFRGPVAALLPLMVGGLAIGLATSSLRLLSHVAPIALMALNVVTFLGLGLAIDYSLFIVQRFREELAEGADPAEAVRRALATAGRTVVYSGVAVAASLLSLLWFPIPLLHSVALGGALVVAGTVVTAMVVLPAALAALGGRVDALSFSRSGRRPRPSRLTGLARVMVRRPAALATVVAASLLLVGLPALRMRTALTDARLFPQGSDVRQVQERLLEPSGFRHLGVSRLSVVVVTDGQVLSVRNGTKVGELEAEIREMPGVTKVFGLADVASRFGATRAADVSPEMLRALRSLVSGDTTVIEVASSYEAGSRQANALVRSIRAAASDDVAVVVGGQAALAEEVRASISLWLPQAIGTVVVVTFVILLLAFGAVPVALEAVVMNALSLAASLGVLVLVFQDGRLEGLLAYQSVGSIDPLIPVLMFAIVFGLSMDYELFLLSRIKEDYDCTGAPRTSVVRGLGQTAGIITSAALMLAVVLAGFAAGRMLFMRELGVGMVVAVALDATVIRALLVPSVMSLLGRANWWGPSHFKAFWRRLGIGVHEGSAVPLRPPRGIAECESPE